jgi:polyhydroxybutyrate depolymerase
VTIRTPWLLLSCALASAACTKSSAAPDQTMALPDAIRDGPSDAPAKDATQEDRATRDGSHDGARDGGPPDRPPPDRVAQDLLAGDRTGTDIPSGCAGMAAGPASWVVRQVAHGGLQREYAIHVPAAYSPSKPTPVVLNLHGGGGTAQGHETLVQMIPKSDQEGFISVYPEGVGVWLLKWWRTWNAGSCCGKARDDGADDVGFIRALLDDLSKDYCVDPRRVFATGHSNGGMMSYRLACELSDRIAAVAPNAGPMGDLTAPQSEWMSGCATGAGQLQILNPIVTYACSPARPVSILHLHGTADTFACYWGGQGQPFPGTTTTDYFRPAPESTLGWATRNGCGTQTSITFQAGNTTCRTYENCPSSAEVTLCTVLFGTHTWGAGSNALAPNDAIWTFFAKHPMP